MSEKATTSRTRPGAGEGRRGKAGTGKRNTKAAQRAEMTEQILDAAEHLFSRDGLYGVTLKDVAERAGAPHLVNYYFGTSRRCSTR